MQRDEKDGVAFWRGELVDGKIRGVISVQVDKSPATAFAFHGEKAGEAKEIPAERVEPQPEIIPEPVAEEPVAPVVDASAVVNADTAAAVTDAAMPTDVVAEVKDEVVAAVAEAVPAMPVVETPAPEVVQPEPVKPPKKKRGFFG